MMQNNYYQNGSCLRPHLLGWKPKTYPKKTKNSLEQAFNIRNGFQKIEKLADVGKKSSPICLFILQVLSPHLFESTPLPDLFNNLTENELAAPCESQFSLFGEIYGQ